MVVAADPPGWVLGADVAAGAWAGILWRGDDVRGVHAATFAGLLAAAHRKVPVSVIAVDIPIGLPDASVRRADVAVRQLLGPRRASVFETPTRAALGADDYAAALRVNRERTGGRGLSRQAFGLRDRILDVDGALAAVTLPVVEAHPELCFARMAGAPLEHPKRTWGGMVQRRRLLAEHGLVLPDDLPELAGRAAVDDVLDAAVVAWLARQCLMGLAVPVPDPPEVFSDGHPAAIWW